MERGRSCARCRGCRALTWCRERLGRLARARLAMEMGYGVGGSVQCYQAGAGVGFVP